MCIICNVTDIYDASVADDFLGHYMHAQIAMKKAADQMLALIPLVTPENRERYKKVHKQLVRVRRDWNNVEHMR